MVAVIDWRSMADPAAVARCAAEAAQALQEGQLVGLPTETVYGIAASALCPQAVERLVSCKGRPEDKPLTLAIRSPIETADWVPGMSKLGRRLSRRCWPGPVTLVFADGYGSGLARWLPPGVRRRVCPNGSLGLRVPAHPVVQYLLHFLPGPLVLTSANRSGEPDATTGSQVAETLGARIDLLIDDGPCRYGQPSSVVRVNGDQWQMLRAGVVPAAALERLSSCVILFVCTGNTCRSPLAEALCRKLLAERLGCTLDELPQRGFVVQSAGISAMMGCGATPEAIETGRAQGVDLSPHVSQPLTVQQLVQADYVFTMTQSHKAAVAGQFPRSGGRLILLSPQGEDVPDPIGQDHVVYQECAQQIVRHLQERLSEIET